MSDVIVIGAGVIGLSLALSLAKRGAKVKVLDRGAPGAEASSAAAGVLGVQYELSDDGPLTRLCLASLELFPRFVTELVESTGIDVGYRRSGGLYLALTPQSLEDMKRALAWQSSLGLSSEVLSVAEARAFEAGVSPDIAGAVRFAADARVDPPSLVKALAAAASAAGASIVAGACVRRVVVEAGRATGVVLEDGARLDASSVVVAAGSWSALIEGASLPDGSVRPARGQIVELLTGPLPVRHVIYGPGCYLSPRDEGRILVGSTLENVGFRPGVTAGGVQALLTSAIRLVPALADVGIGRLWSGFRPRPSGDLPLLGATSIDGLFLATGHFRNGVMLAPITASIMTSVIEGAASLVDLAPFSAARLEATADAARPS